jgi:hypothetical protein
MAPKSTGATNPRHPSRVCRRAHAPPPPPRAAGQNITEQDGARHSKHANSTDCDGVTGALCVCLCARVCGGVLSPSVVFCSGQALRDMPHSRYDCLVSKWPEIPAMAACSVICRNCFCCALTDAMILLPLLLLRPPLPPPPPPPAAAAATASATAPSFAATATAVRARSWFTVAPTLYYIRHYDTTTLRYYCTGPTLLLY